MSGQAEAEDAALLRAVAAGDEAALQLLFTRHGGWLQARLSRRCADHDVVADVLQDTFVAAWQGARRWRGDGEVGAWLWGIAVRRLVSRLRGRKLPFVAVAGIDGAGISAEEQVLLGVEYGDVGTALQRLSPELRAVVQATILDGLSTREAARLLDLPQGTVKGRIRKAKAQLRSELVPGF
jgi:RNA polymerase sigma-70 factor, ECF subfamily